MFLIESEGKKIGELYSADTDGAKRVIVAAIEAGMVITFQRATEPKLSVPEAWLVSQQAPRMQPKRIPAAASTPRKVRRVLSHKSEPILDAPSVTRAPPKVTTETPEGSEYKIDDRVYLNWTALAESQKLNFSSKRWSFGVVEQFRSGAGIRSTVGIRFESDDHLTWMQPKDLSTRPQTEG